MTSTNSQDLSVPRPITTQGYAAADFPTTAPSSLGPSHPVDGWFSLLRHSIARTSEEQYRNVDLLPIAYAFRPRLRGRLTLGGRTFPRKPWDFGGRDSHPACRYSCPHHHFRAVYGFIPRPKPRILPDPLHSTRNASPTPDRSEN